MSTRTVESEEIHIIELLYPFFLADHRLPRYRLPVSHPRVRRWRAQILACWLF